MNSNADFAKRANRESKPSSFSGLSKHNHKLDCRQLCSWQKIVFVIKKNVNSQRFCLFPFLGFRESYSLSTPQLSQSKFEKKKKDYIIGAVTHTMVKWIFHVDEAVVNFNGE